MAEADRAERRRTRPASYVIFYLLFALTLFAAHGSLLRLPYYWDEAGQYVPSALDILEGGHWIPQSVTPNVHPPGVPAYLAAVWTLFGYTPAVTRAAMLAWASLGVLAAFLLAIELCRGSKGSPALFAAFLLCISPLFVAQSMLAQLDAPAMVFTTLALLRFAQNRIILSAAACCALVAVKETGLVVPLVFALWLIHERRWRDLPYFAAPAVLVGTWLVALRIQTGHWLGSTEFTQYNLFDPLHPLRMGITLVRRIYFLCVANCHWIGFAAIAYAALRTRTFATRSWRVAWLVVAAHVALLTVLGGAVLERYLLPVLPIVYAAMVSAFATLTKRLRLAASAALLAGLAAFNFVNPPYPFPFEDNLAFTDFVKLHRDAAGYLEQWYPKAVVHTTWPMTSELAYPRLGYVGRAMAVKTVPNFSSETLRSLDWRDVNVLVAFSKTWDPPLSGLRIPLVGKVWRSAYGYVPNVSEGECRRLAPLELAAHFERHGQWVDIFVNPAGPPALRARYERAAR